VSHIVRIQTQVRDATAVFAACRHRQLAEPVPGKHRLFSSEVEGLAVRLRDWQFPAVCQLDTGEVQYDNYGGRWGDQRELDSFLQSYAVEKARIEAHKRGHTITEQSLADGSIKLTVQVGGAA
jgi:hypothetical protein